ncbi:MAG: hypothetical protein PWP67_1129 [Clostridium butyricum]|nr:hypothetical protein [Clostridium butyricum]
MLNKFIEQQRRELEKSIEGTYISPEVENINTRVSKIIDSIQKNDEVLALDLDDLIGELILVVSDAYYNHGFKDSIRFNKEIEEVKESGN